MRETGILRLPNSVGRQIVQGDLGRRLWSLLVGKTNQLPQSLWFLLFEKRTPDMRVGSNGRESSARTMAVVA